MVQNEITFNDGTRIFYEETNGRMQRFIEYALSPIEKEKIKEKPLLKFQYESLNRKHNAGKYYYLEVLHAIVLELTDGQKNRLYSDLKGLHDKTSDKYDSSIINRSFLETFGKYWPGNMHQCASFFTTIYLAMVDLEDGKKYNPRSTGKTMVLKGCEAVILKGVDPKVAATMFERKHNTASDGWDGDFGGDDSRYEKYNGYNGYDDDTIDDAFDGYPEATWK